MNANSSPVDDIPKYGGPTDERNPTKNKRRNMLNNSRYELRKHSHEIEKSSLHCFSLVIMKRNEISLHGKDTPEPARKKERRERERVLL